jgi:hypothetical protein
MTEAKAPATDRPALMPLFWLVHDIDGERRVMIRDDGPLIYARLRAAIDGFGGTFIEAHVLDAKTAKKIPKRMIGRALTASEAAALLDRLG